MDCILSKFKRFEVFLPDLKKALGEDLYNVSGVTPEKVSASDVVNAIKLYLEKTVSLSALLDWVNVVWFTELFEYVVREENSIASAMTLLETLDEGIEFTDEEYHQMVECLEANKECDL